MKALHILSFTSTALQQGVLGFTDKKLAAEVLKHLSETTGHSILLFENVTMITKANVGEHIPNWDEKHAVAKT